MGRNPSAASRRNATAIDEVRLSMSMAPRPQTSPSIDLATEGVVAPSVGIHGDDIGVAHETQRRSVGVGALDPGDHRVASGRGVNRSTSSPAPSR